MSPKPEDCTLCDQRLRHLLTTLILNADGYHWPGTDGLMIEDVLHEYPKAAHEHRVPDRDELCLRHPEMALAVADFFDSRRTTA